MVSKVHLQDEAIFVQALNSATMEEWRKNPPAKYLYNSIRQFKIDCLSEYELGWQIKVILEYDTLNI